MSEWAWLNGEMIPLAEAQVSVEDRGFQFADGVYEVIRLYDGRPFTLDEHLDRLDRSCEGIRLKMPVGRQALVDAIANVSIRSEIAEGMVYVQATRGVSRRNHLFPTAAATLLCYARTLPPPPVPGEGAGVRLLSVADERWKRCWIKSIALLPNILAKNQAVAAGADEAAFIDGGYVTECSASNLFAVIGETLMTPSSGPKVLPGITRAVILDCATKLGICNEERSLEEQEAMGADELFVTSTTREVGWVSRWNDRAVGTGACGAITLRLHQALQSRTR